MTGGFGLSSGASLASASYQVLHEDAHLLVVHKDAGLLTVPGIGIEKEDCLLSRLRKDGHSDISHAAHRLDRDTSGVIALGKGSAAHRALCNQFQSRQTKKLYTAIVCGWMAEERGSIDKPIGKVGSCRERMAYPEHAKT